MIQAIFAQGSAPIAMAFFSAMGVGSESRNRGSEQCCATRTLPNVHATVANMGAMARLRAKEVNSMTIDVATVIALDT